MRERMTGTTDTGGERPAARKGDTVTAQGEDQHAVPQTPNERDESAHSVARQEPNAKAMGEAAQRDMERGLVDTSKGAELDATYEKVREGLPDGDKQFRP